MKDFFFKPDRSCGDCIFLAVAAHGFAQGDFLAPLVVMLAGLLVHLGTTARWYD